MLKQLGPRGKDFGRYVHWAVADSSPQPIYPCSPLGSSIMPPVQKAIYVGGKNDGSQLPDLWVESNSVGRLSFGFLTPRRGHVRVEVNPELYETAIIQGPALIDERCLQEIFIIVRASKKTSLDLPWLVKLYVED